MLLETWCILCKLQIWASKAWPSKEHVLALASQFWKHINNVHGNVDVDTDIDIDIDVGTRRHRSRHWFRIRHRSPSKFDIRADPETGERTRRQRCNRRCRCRPRTKFDLACFWIVLHTHARNYYLSTSGQRKQLPLTIGRDRHEPAQQVLELASNQQACHLLLDQAHMPSKLATAAAAIITATTVTAAA